MAPRTIRGEKPGDILRLIAEAAGVEPEARSGGTHWYAAGANIGRHALVAWSPRERPDSSETYIEVRQSGLDELGAARSIGLASDLLDAGTRFTRVDGFYDDLARHAEPSTVAQAFRDRQAVSHIRRMREIREYVLADAGEGAEPDGSTTYLGSPSSNAMLRVYDKAAESGRAAAGVRWEVQMRRQRAQLFAAGVVVAGDRLGAYVLGCIRATR